MFKYLLISTAMFASLGAHASDAALNVTKVNDHVYAIVGEIDDRSYDNDGLNNNQAFIVAKDGVILIDSGASKIGAARIEKAIAGVTKTPVKWVINTGSQDHRWLGNDYFAKKGAEVIAFEDTVATQKKVGAQQIDTLKKTLKERMDGTTPAYATRMLKDSPAKLDLGGENLEVMYTNAHFPGDSMVWLPKEKILVSGDLIYVDRMLGVHDTSSVKNAWAAWQELVKLNPTTIIPGHGQVCDMAKAKKDTGDYYAFLINVIAKAAQDMAPMDEVIKANADRPEFKHLKHYDTWHKTIMNRTYLQFEGQ